MRMENLMKNFEFLEKTIKTIPHYDYEKLFENMQGVKKAYLYGAGSGGTTSLDWIKKNFDCDILGFIDSSKNKQGKIIAQKKVYSLSNVEKDSTILVTSTFHKEISNFLEVNGYKNYLVLPIDLIIWDEFKTITYLKNLSEIEKLKKVYMLLKDEVSKEIFVRTLLYRWTWDDKWINQSTYPQYCIETIDKKDIENIVDAGAFDGDTIKLFKDYFYNMKKIYAFEPTSKNILKIKEKFKNESSFKVYPIEKGLWDKCETLRFFQTDSIGGNNKVIEDKDEHSITIEVVDLDSCLDLNSRIDLIKMDIEGAEFKALSGAKSLISKNYPILQICIYHNIDHYCEIIEYIETNFPNMYTYEIGHHSDWMMETVLYAIPKERKMI